MKMYLPFGDWSCDGHGHYEKVLIDAPSMEHLLKTQEKIKQKYGAKFFEEMETGSSHFSRAVWEALIETKYPIERFKEKEDVNDWSDCETLQEVLEIEPNPYISTDLLIDVFIWILNAYGAEIKNLDDEEKIPTICNWTCRGFKTVGYKCLAW